MNAFNGCSSATSIIIPSKVEAIESSAFGGCSKLTSMLIPSSVTSIYYNSFTYCSGLTSIEVESGNTKYHSSGNCLIITASNTVAAGCKNSTIPSTITTIGSSAFYGCSGLRSITIPASVKTISSNAFNNCSGLTSLSIPASVTSIGERAFDYCSGLGSISVATGNTVYSSSGNCLIEKSSKTLILGCKNSTIPTNGTVTKIGNDAFSACTGLTSITIPSGVTSIGNYAFEGCYSLNKITFSKTSGSVSIGYQTFDARQITMDFGGKAWTDGSTTYTAATIGNASNLNDKTWNIVDPVTYYTVTYDIDGVISTRQVPENSTLSDYFPTGKTEENTCGFYRNSNYTGLVLGSTKVTGNMTLYTATATSNLTFTSVTGGYSVKASSTSGTSYVIPLKHSGSYVVEVTDFAQCQSAESIIISGRVTTISGYALGRSSSLTSIVIPASVTSIGEGVLSECESLATITVESGNTKYYGSNNCLIETSSKTLIAGCKNSIIPSGVTTIGVAAFEGCFDSFTSITIPSSVTSIRNYAFRFCSKLNKITFSKTSGSVSIGYQTFDARQITMDFGGKAWTSGSTTYTAATIGNASNLNSSSSSTMKTWNIADPVTYYTVTYDIDGVISTRQVPENSTLSDYFPTGKTEENTCGFYRDQNLTNLVNSDTEKITGNVKYYSSNATSGLELALLGGSGDGASVAQGSAGSSSKIVIPLKYDGEFVTTIADGGFQGCSSMTSIFMTPKITDIRIGAFWDCSSLNSFTFPSNIKSLGESAFRNCSSLTSITIPSTITTIGGWSLAGCSGLTSITVASGNTAYRSEGNCLIERNTNTLISGCKNSVIPSTVTSIGYNAFYESGLTSITIPSSVTSIGGEAFYGCSSMTSITFNKTSGTIEIGLGAFDSTLTNVDFGGKEWTSSDGTRSYTAANVGNASNLNDKTWNIADPVTYYTITYYVDNVRSTKSVPANATLSGYFPTGKTEENTCGFYENSNYTGLKLGSTKVTGNMTLYTATATSGLALTSISGGVSVGKGSAGSSSKIVIPLKYNGQFVTRIADEAFYGCSSMTSIIIPSKVTDIGYRTFAYCSGLTSITIPEGVTMIDGDVFDGCSKLTSVTIPSSVTSIGELAFAGCSGLTEITIPSSVTSIGAGAFKNCSKLKNVYFRKTSGTISIGTDAFDSKADLNANFYGKTWKNGSTSYTAGVTNPSVLNGKTWTVS